MAKVAGNPPPAGSFEPLRGTFTAAGVEIRWLRDGDPSMPIYLFAHGAGAPCTHPFMDETAVALRDRGLCVVRWNFPYMERNQREGRRRAPDRAPVLLETLRAVVATVCTWVPAPRLVLGGKSMGGRMASMLLAEDPPPAALAAVYLGYPLRAAGRPDRERAAHLSKVPVPQLFVTGSRDPLCSLDRLREVLAPLGARARLHVVEGGDHSLGVRGTAAASERSAWLDAIAVFMTAPPR
jgi:hypothetical protein